MVAGEGRDIIFSCTVTVKMSVFLEMTSYEVPVRNPNEMCGSQTNGDMKVEVDQWGRGSDQQH